MEDNKVMVQNLTDGDLVYIDNDGGISRRIIFKAQQIMPVDRALLDRMRYDEGGSVMVRDFLSVKDEAFRDEIGIPEDQIEYDYTKEDVINLLQENNIDAIADALDFGPLGIKGMIILEAVNLPIVNRDMMAVISEKTNKNIEMMINNKQDLEKATVDEDKPVNHSRRRTPASRKKSEEKENTQK